MFWLRSCSKCNGDLHEDMDQYGTYIACLQCGHYLTEAEEVLLRYSEVRSAIPVREVQEELQTATAV